MGVLTYWKYKRVSNKGNQSDIIQAGKDVHYNTMNSPRAGEKSQAVAGDNNQLISNVTLNVTCQIENMFPQRDKALEQLQGHLTKER